MKILTITMTDRPPIEIDVDAWPIIAEANDSWHDGQVECQANRKESLSVKVRQHADGRTIVYARYGYDSSWSGEPSRSVRVGILTSKDNIADAISRIGIMLDGRDIATHQVSIPDCIAECIADLPAERI